MDTDLSNYVFYAEMNRGNVYKVLNETFNKKVKRSCWHLSKDEGLLIRDLGAEDTILYDCIFSKKEFRKYKCEDDMYITILTGHMYEQLKNVKKKDIVTFFIEKEGQKRSALGISIRPENKTEISRHEVNYITYQQLKSVCRCSIDELECLCISPEYILLPLPDTEHVDGVAESDAYYDPITIEAQEFQKIKKLIKKTGQRQIEVKIQRGGYISFSGDDSKMSWGVINPAYETYTEKYNCESFGAIIKLPGLCTHMQFFAPKANQDYPLKIEIKISQNSVNFGDIKIFIKNSRIIAEFINEKCDIQPVKVAGKRGRKKIAV